MAAPEYVPRSVTETARTYVSPPRRPDEWMADRPAELAEGQPDGPGLGYQGPDQGYALRLVRFFDGQLVLTEGEHASDVEAGCVVVALRRASMFGRAPVIHDLTVAFSIWGFLDAADPELVALRRPLFEGIAHPHHGAGRHRVAELIDADVLRRSPAGVKGVDWRVAIDVDAASAPTHH